MSTHRHVRQALDEAIAAHRESHRDHLEAVDLGDFTEATISPVGAPGDFLVPAGDENA